MDISKGKEDAMSLKVGDKVLLLDPRDSHGSNSSLGLSDEFLRMLIGKEVEVSRLSGDLSFYFEISLPAFNKNPARRYVICWPNRDVEIFPPAKEKAEADPYAGYTKTQDGFWTNPENWKKWLI